MSNDWINSRHVKPGGFVFGAAVALVAAGCGGGGRATQTSGGGGTTQTPCCGGGVITQTSGGALTTPQITVTPAASSVTTAQKLSVVITVAGSAGTPAGTVTVSSGSYASAATALSSGSATIPVPAGLLTIGSDTLTATFTGASSSTYANGSATGTVTVSAGATTPAVTVAGTSYVTTQSAPFQAIVAPAGGTVFVAESGGVEIFTKGGSGLSSSCVQTLPMSLVSEHGEFSELSYLPNGVSIGAGIGDPGAVFYNAAALESCAATGTVVSQGAISAGEGSQAVAVTNDGKFAFVSNEYGVASGSTLEGNVGVVELQYDGNGDVTGGTLLGQIATGGQAIAGILLSPDGTRLYVTSEVAGKTTTASGSSNAILGSSNCVQQVGGSPQLNGLLSVVDVSQAETAANSSAILATVAAGCSPVRMAETSDNSTLWVAARGDNRVLAFSTGMLELDASNALLGYASTGGTAPVGITLFHNQQFLAVANSNRFGAGPNANATILSVSYPAGASVVQTVNTGLFPREVTDGPDDATLYLTNYDSDTLEVISTQ